MTQSRRKFVLALRHMSSKIFRFREKSQSFMARSTLTSDYKIRYTFLSVLFEPSNYDVNTPFLMLYQ